MSDFKARGVNQPAAAVPSWIVSGAGAKKDWKPTGKLRQTQAMSDSNTTNLAKPVVSLDEVQREWADLKDRVGMLEGERALLERENKTLRLLLERVVEHRQRSHGELILLLTNLVSKLPISDVGVVVAKLVEHNANVAEVCAALSKGSVDATLPQPTVLKNLEQTKRELRVAVKAAVEEFQQSKPPLEPEMLQELIAHPESFFAPKVVRAFRCYIKGQLLRERVVREFGEAALVCFTDLTTDPKLNPRPKPGEIILAFKPDFDALLGQLTAMDEKKRQQLKELHERVQASRAQTEVARAQRNACQRMTFLLELLHYYENQATEAPDVIFALRLPGLLEQLVVAPGQEKLENEWITMAESLLAFISNLDQRLMVINNMGKSGGLAQLLKYVLRLRVEKIPDENEVVHEFVRSLIPPAPEKPPTPKALANVLRHIADPDRQKLVVRGIMSTDRMPRADAELLGRAVGTELGLAGLGEEVRAAATISPEVERRLAWDKVTELINRRAEPTAIAAAIRDRLHAKYDADEVKQSWITLIETEPISFIRTFCQLPYLADGSTDPIARTVLETYITRLTHEKYAATYSKVMNSLKNMFKAKPDSPTLVNFLALVKWVDAEAARKLSADIGMPA
jgi:hypothetical protein